MCNTGFALQYKEHGMLSVFAHFLTSNKNLLSYQLAYLWYPEDCLGHSRCSLGLSVSICKNRGSPIGLDNL